MKKMLVIIGPTASGKTRFAVYLASRFNGEIISADSRQVYKGMDIGTGKDLEEYFYNGIKIPYHLIDIVDAGTKYNVFEYQKDFLKVFDDIVKRDSFPIMCGGSGLYIESVIKSYKLLPVPCDDEFRKWAEKTPESVLIEELKKMKSLHNKTDIDTKKRLIRALEIERYYIRNKMVNENKPSIQSIVVGIDVDREIRRKKIDARLEFRLRNGLIEEVKSLIDNGIDTETLIYYGLEYKFITNYLLGKISFREMKEKLNIAIHQFAKRQMTWFRGMERRGIEIQWIKAEDNPEEMLKKIKFREQR